MKVVGPCILRRSLPAALAAVLLLGSAHAKFTLTDNPGAQSCSANPAGATSACDASGPASP